MRFVDLIEIKKTGGMLSPAQIADAVTAYVAGDVPDYQMAALLMAIRWRGLSDDETAALTQAMVASGERWRFDDLGVPVDKHSTGGVGDKVSLVLAPLAAAAGCVVPMVSGRGLAHTGGTLDKLESIPGLRTDLDERRFRDQLERIGVAMGAQTERFVPADRLLYALRDVTATVDDSGLITASILSKKIAEGTSGLVLDVKVGSGAFFPDVDAASAFADRIGAVAEHAGLRIGALLTDMSQPLGQTVGNAIEVREALETLRGSGPADLRELVVALAAEMIVLAGLEDSAAAGRGRAVAVLDSGAALERFADLIASQGGDPRCVDDLDRLPESPRRQPLRPPRAGYVQALGARAVGEACCALRAGRAEKDDVLDLGAGIHLHAKRGEPVDPDEPWATLVYGDGTDKESAERLLSTALTIADEPPPAQRLILAERR